MKKLKFQEVENNHLHFIMIKMKIMKYDIKISKKQRKIEITTIFNNS